MRIEVPEVIPPLDELGPVHFVGIGGAGLSGIARIMRQRGVAVSGSDGADSPALAALEELGARVHVGHDASHLGDAQTLVVSTAVREDNPEVVEARVRGLRLLPRSAGLATLMQGRRTVAVAGTHGKTTTTSMLTCAVRAAGGDPTYAVGGTLRATGTNAHAGADDLFIAEADESDGAFLVYSPWGAVVTNVDADHLDHFGSVEAYSAAFDSFLGRIHPDGFLVCVTDDPGAAALAATASAQGLRVVRVGTGPDCDLRLSELELSGGRSRASVERAGQATVELRLQVPGRHYLLDAAAALAAGLELGYEVPGLLAGLESFSGTGRRMEPKGEAGGVRVYDTYAHHPQEIAADLEAARSLAGDGRLVVAFQPHLVSRTRIFGVEMGRALAAADDVVVLEVLAVREDPDPSVTGALVADACPLPEGRVLFEPAMERVPAELVRRASPGDVIVTVGAGTVTELAAPILRLLERGPEAR